MPQDNAIPDLVAYITDLVTDQKYSSWYQQIYQQESMRLFRMENKEFLQQARTVAKLLLKEIQQEITIDDVRIACHHLKLRCPHQNVWGHVFQSKDFTRTGYTRSVRPSNHGRVISRYQLSKGQQP